MNGVSEPSGSEPSGGLLRGCAASRLRLWSRKRAGLLAGVLMASLWFAAFAFAGSGNSPPAPTPQQIYALNEQTVGKLAAQDAVHRQWLASSEARHQRVASRTSYAGLSDSGALSLASQLFPGIAAKGWHGLVPPAGQKLVGYAGPQAAVVADAHGHRSVVQSRLPLLGRTPASSEAPVDLGLREAGAAFVPASASVRLQLPKTADGKMGFPDLGIGVRVAAARDVHASLSNDHLGYARALADTDMFWQATPLGAEQAFQLRSPDSPRDITLKFDLAPGDTLRVTGKDDLMGSPMGSAEIDRNGQSVLSMVAPSAVDAQGAPVAVSYSVSSSAPNSLRLHVADGGDVAWPVMVDPNFVEGTWGVNSANPTTTSPEHWYSSAPYSDFAAFYQNQNLEVGGNAAYGPYYNNDYGLWAVSAPGPTQHNGIFMYRLQNQGVQHGDYPSPYGSPAYTYYQLEIINNALTTPLTGGGYKNGSGPTYLFGGHYAEYAEGGSDGGSTFDVCANTPSYLNGAGSSPNACSPTQYDGPVGAPPVGYFELVVWNGTGYQWPNAPQLYVPNEATWLSDDVTPSLSAPAPSNSNGWYQSYSGSSNVSANDTGPDSSLSGGGNSDSGLGIQSITLSSQQGGVTDATGGSAGLTIKPNPACDSTNSSLAYGSCIGNSASGTISYKTVDSGSGAIPEGANTVTATATSISGETTTQSWPLNIDRTPPTINVSGPIYDHYSNNTAIGGGTVDVGVDAYDAGPNNASIQTSGVVSVEFKVDGVDSDPANWHVTQTCSAGNCDMYPTFTVNTASLSQGPHTFAVTAIDQAGNSTTDSETVTVNPTQPLSPRESNGAPAPAQSTASTAMTPAETAAVANAQVFSPSVIASSLPASTAGGSFSPSLGTVTGVPGYVATGSDGGAHFNSSVGDGMVLDTNWGGVTLVPQGISSADPGAVVNGTALVYGQTAQGADTILRPTDLGVASYTQIDTATAPETYSWSVSMDGGQILQQLPDGSIAILANTSPIDSETSADSGDTSFVDPYPDGEYHGEANLGLTAPSVTSYQANGTLASDSNASTERTTANDAAAQFNSGGTALAYASQQTAGQNPYLVAVIHAPWAVDANGTPVPTSLSVSGNVVTLTVAHHEGVYTYPIMADPTADSCRDTNPCASSSSGPNVGAMQAYAYKWRQARNSYYHAFNNDCTNFMSQILHAGGMPMLHYDQHIQGSDTWWDDKKNDDWSNSWTLSVAYVHQWLHFGFAKRVTDWQPGDFVGWGWKNDDHVDHLDFVYEVVNGEPYFLQHTKDYSSPHSKSQFDQDVKQEGNAPARMWHFRITHT